LTSQHQCPTCRRTFEEGGFCPFDRARLVSLAHPDAQTLLSSAMPAVNPEEARQTRPYAPSSTPEEAKRTSVDNINVAQLAKQLDSDAKPTHVDARRTFPMPGPQTQEVTVARARPTPPASAVAPPQRMSAVSASVDTSNAIAAFKLNKSDKGDNEYDRLVGETLDGRYFVEKKIGEGGMGVVFSARHSVIERPLAIKVLKREVMRDTATIKRFIQEAKAASRIGHPNIVDVTDFGTTPDGMTYSVMEYVAGQTLGHALRHSAPFPQTRAIKVTVQIARALGAAHDKGIVHRDLKPENVFLTDRDGRTDFVKIVDFGIAKVVPVGGSNPNEPRLTRAGSVFGTPEYMAPEQAAGKGDTDGRVDIYALGVLLYEMLTGKVPHRGDSTVRTLAMVMLDPVEPPSRVRPDANISPDLEAVVLHALAKKRETRFQTMGEFVTALESVQPVIGKSITGTPVYALVPLPPGATPHSVVTPSVGPSLANTGNDHHGQSIDEASRHARPAIESASRRAHRDSGVGSVGPVGPVTQRRAHEPEFTARDKPQTFEHVFTAETHLPTRRRWPLVLFLLLILGGAATAITVVITSRNRVTTPRDAAEVVKVPVDAAVAHEDAAPEPIADAADIVVVEVDAGRIRPPSRIDAGVIVAVPVGPDAGVHGMVRGHQIQVITKPEGASLYAGFSYTGVGGTWIERPVGTKLDLECRMSGYKPGKLQLQFDGKTEYALCTLQRVKVCVNELKNPFDECQDAPAPAPAP
jgi:serine/threonine protein kinase